MEENILVKVGADIGELVRGMGDATKEIQNFAKKNEKTFKTIGTIGKVITSGSLAIAGGLGLASKSAIDFESAFAGVRKTVDASEEQFAVLEQGIRDMSKELPASAGEIAGVAEAAGQLGIAYDDIMGFTRVMIDLGEATNMSAETAATSLARFANITQMPMKNIDRLGATIVALGNNLATTESEITEMALRLAGAGSQIGLTEDQILSFSGALSSVGIEAEAGGSAFSKVMIDMSSAIQAGGKELDKFARVAGMSSSEFKKAFEEDAAGAIIAFIQGLGEMSEEGENVFGVLDDLGLSEIRVRDALLRAAGASDLFSESLELGANAWEENTALTDEAAQRYKTVAAQLSMLKNTIKDAAISVGNALLPAITFVTDALRKLIEMFNRLPEPVKSTIAVGLALVSVLGLIAGPLLIFISMLPNLIAGFQALQKGMAIVKGTAIATVAPILAVIAVVAALIGGFIYLYKTSEGFRESINKVVSVVKDKLLSAFGKAKELFGDIAKAIGPKLSKIVERLAESFSKLVDAISRVLSGDMSGVTDLFKQFAPSIIGMLVGGIPGIVISASKYMPAIAEGMQKNFPKILGVITGVINSIADGIAENLPVFVETGIGIIKNLITGVTTALPLILETILTVLTSLITMITENLPMIIDTGVTLLQSLLDGIIFALPIVFDTVLSVLMSIVDAIVTNLPLIIESGITILTALIDGIMSILPTLITAALTLIMTLATTLIDNLPKIIDAGIEILLALIEGIIEILPQLIDTAILLIISIVTAIADNLPKIFSAGGKILKELLEGIKELLPKLIKLGWTLVKELAGAIIESVPDIFDAGADLIKGLWNGINSVKDWIKGKIGGFMDGIVGGIKSFFGIHSPSTLFRDEVGKMLSLGLVDGIVAMKNDVIGAARNLTEWATPEPPNVSLAYATPKGTYGTLNSAVKGTVDVNSRDDMLASAVESLARKLDGLVVEMDGRTVGKLVAPTVSREIYKATKNVRRGGGAW